MITRAREKIDEGDLNTAKTLLISARALGESDLGKDHPDIVSAETNLAAVAFAQSDYGEAQKLYENVLNASKRVLGEKDPFTIQAISNLAATLSYQGKYDEAAPLLLHAYHSSGNREEVFRIQPS